jgi:hypothetical protein
MKKRLGVVGSLVWDVIHGRDAASPPVEEWGGIAYALSSLDAHLPPDWEIVPLIKVGRDLSAEAGRFMRTLTRLVPGGRCIEVPVPNNRVVLRYQSTERRCERMSGGVPSWNWGELGPMVQDLDAVYVNFISGFEMCMGTAQALRQGFSGPIYGDLHSLFLGMQQDGMRTLQPLRETDTWFSCFDVVQMNEEEMQQVSRDPLNVAAQAMAQGVRLLAVTLGPKGVVYVTDTGESVLARGQRGGPTRSALIPAPYVEDPDPTGCGDVFGAALFARLLGGDPVETALREAAAAGARNAAFRGAGGLAQHLRGELVSL